MMVARWGRPTEVLTVGQKAERRADWWAGAMAVKWAGRKGRPTADMKVERKAASMVVSTAVTRAERMAAWRVASTADRRARM